MKKILTCLAIYLISYNVTFAGKSNSVADLKKKSPAKDFINYISNIPEVKDLLNKQLATYEKINWCTAKRHDATFCKDKYKNEIYSSNKKIEKVVLSRINNGDKKLKSLYKSLSL